MATNNSVNLQLANFTCAGDWQFNGNFNVAAIGNINIFGTSLNLLSTGAIAIFPTTTFSVASATGTSITDQSNITINASSTGALGNLSLSTGNGAISIVSVGGNATLQSSTGDVNITSSVANINLTSNTSLKLQSSAIKLQSNLVQVVNGTTPTKIAQFDTSSIIGTLVYSFPNVGGTFALTKPISVTKTVYVAAGGSDTTGDGSAYNPWATVSYAMAQIILQGPSQSNRFAIKLYVGQYSESVAINWAPWVWLVGEGPITTQYRNTAGILLDPTTWSTTNTNGFRLGFSNVGIYGTTAISWNFATALASNPSATRAVVVNIENASINPSFTMISTTTAQGISACDIRNSTFILGLTLDGFVNDAVNQNTYVGGNLTLDCSQTLTGAKAFSLYGFKVNGQLIINNTANLSIFTYNLLDTFAFNGFTNPALVFNAGTGAFTVNVDSASYGTNSTRKTITGSVTVTTYSL